MKLCRLLFLILAGALNLKCCGQNLFSVLYDTPGAPLWMQQTQRAIFKSLSDNYIPLGSIPFAYGPVMSTASGNGLEGWRLQLGVVSDARLDRHLFLSGYCAYGFRDHKFKYMGRAEWSFAPKIRSASEYPVRSVFVQYDYDIDLIGQRFVRPGVPDLMLAIARHSNRKSTYRRQAKGGTNLELSHDLRIGAAMAWQRQYATKYLPFVNGYGECFHAYDRVALELTADYTPGIFTRQAVHSRKVLTPYTPVFGLNITISPGNLLNTPAPLVMSRLTYRQLHPLDEFAFIDIVADAAHIWSRTPYPTLLYPPANGTYFIRRTSFAMMLPMEFVTDSYAALFLQYSPGLLSRWHTAAKSGLSESLLIRSAIGTLSKRNNPDSDYTLLQLPVGTGEFDGLKPYIEGGICLDGLLGLFRLEYVWRLTYRNRADISKAGLCIGLNLSL